MAKQRSSASAQHAFRAWRAVHPTGDDREAICDLITDLMHLVDTDRERFDMYDGETVGDNAMRDYLEEVNDSE